MVAVGFAAMMMGAPATSHAACGDVSLAKMNWASAEIISTITEVLMKQGYQCNVTMVPSATTTAITSLAENNEPDVVPELWINSPIMLMDEAYSALDPLIRTDMQDLLLELQKDLHKTIVFITHDLDEALKLADHLVILKDGYVVQQGESQDILLNPCDPYIEDFVSDINRARVLRVRSVMTPITSEINAEGSVLVDQNQTLESLIAQSKGDVAQNFLVTNEGNPVGTLEMKDLVKALVPRVASSAGIRGEIQS